MPQLRPEPNTKPKKTHSLRPHIPRTQNQTVLFSVLSLAEEEEEEEEEDGVCMEDPCRIPLQDSHLASRKAEEAGTPFPRSSFSFNPNSRNQLILGFFLHLLLLILAALRRFQAAAWLENLVGPLGLPNNPSESEFLSCLRSGLVLCNAINRIQPGSVPKVLFFPTLISFLSWGSLISHFLD